MTTRTDLPKNLPATWEWSTFGDVGEYVNGYAFSKSDWGKEGRPIIRIQNLTGTGDSFNYYDGEIDSKYIVEPDTLLISWSATLGAYIWRGDEAVLNQHIYKVKPRDNILKKYLYYVADFSDDELMRRAHGSGMKHVTKTVFEEFPIPLPPLAEQRRIVSKIEELFSNLDAGRESLQLAKRQLERYRLSVLQAAVEGYLTADWRRKRSPEPADHWGERILEEHKEAWEEQFRSKYEDADRSLPSNWRSKYDAPEIGTFAGLPSLPQGWSWTRLECLLSEHLRNGRSAKTAEDGNGVRVLTLSAITDGEFTLENTKIGDFDEERIADLWLEPGDLLIERSNTEELVGTTRLYTGRKKFAIFPDLVIRARTTDALDNRYAELALQSQRTRTFFRTRARGTSGSMQKINQSIVRDAPIPVPPKAEQRRIVAQVDRLLSVADDSGDAVVTEQERAQGLRQSILRSALSGRITN